MTITVQAPGGRVLEVHESGDAAGFPVVIHHGTPASGLPYGRVADESARQGIRLVSYDRPGYGGSTRAPGRDVAHCAADVTAIADALGLERFASWGISGGGPHVLACAALCDERLVAAAALASVAPYEAEGLAFLEGMGEENHVEFGKALAGERDLREYLDAERLPLLDADPVQLVGLMHTLLGPEDRSVLSGALAEYMIETDRHGLADGVDGWLDDDLAFTRPWGFELAEIDRPVLLVHGDDDRFVPISHGRWLARRIPGVEVWTDATDGHLTLLERRLGPINDWLLARAGQGQNAPA